MFKFSIRQLLIVTTVFAVLTAIAIRLNLISVSDWQVIGLLGAAYLAYLLFVGAIFGSRYYREFVQLQKNRQQQKVTRAELEHEVQSKQLRENEKKTTPSDG